MSVTTDYLIDLFTEEIIVEPYVSETDYGAVTYGAPVTYPAQFAGKVSTVIGSDGQEHVSMVQVILGGAFGVTSRDRFTLPLRYSSNPSDYLDMTARQPTAVAVGSVSDETGPAYEKIFF